MEMNPPVHKERPLITFGDFGSSPMQGESQGLSKKDIQELIQKELKLAGK